MAMSVPPPGGSDLSSGAVVKKTIATFTPGDRFGHLGLLEGTYDVPADITMNMSAVCDTECEVRRICPRGANYPPPLPLVFGISPRRSPSHLSCPLLPIAFHRFPPDFPSCSCPRPYPLRPSSAQLLALDRATYDRFLRQDDCRVLNNLAGYLGTIPPFSELPKKRLVVLAALAAVRTVPRGEVLLEQDEAATDVHIVRRGEARITMQTSGAGGVWGGRLDVLSLREGDHVGLGGLLPRKEAPMVGRLKATTELEVRVPVCLWSRTAASGSANAAIQCGRHWEERDVH